jgi:hypothetical protein
VAKEKYSKANEVEVRRVVFLGPHIAEIMRENEFDETLREVEDAA